MTKTFISKPRQTVHAQELHLLERGCGGVCGVSGVPHTAGLKEESLSMHYLL